MRRALLAALLVALFLAMASATMAQNITGTITGTVKDQAGAVVPAATVTVTNSGTGYSRTAATSSSGTYDFPLLPLGEYRLTVTKEGFKTNSQTGIVLHVGATAVVDAILEIGSVTQRVTVEAAPITVNTTNGTVGQLIQGAQVRQLPLEGRNFTELLTLVPGVVPKDNFNFVDKGLLGGADFSVGGGTETGNYWSIDGAPDLDTGSDRTILSYPSIGSIAEFRILTNSYGPQYAGGGGAQITIVTRSGTNKYHGDVFYDGRNSALVAEDPFLKGAGQPKQPLTRNDYGLSVGGPILPSLKNKAFFFWSEEWNKEGRGVVETALVPTAAELAGNFPAPGFANTDGNLNMSNCAVTQGNPITNDYPRDPANGDYIGNSGVPAGATTSTGIPVEQGISSSVEGLDTGGQLYMSLYPAANVTPTVSNPCPNPNWVTAPKTSLYWRQDNIRSDINLTKTTQLMVKFVNEPWNNPAPNDNFSLWGESGFPAVNSNWSQPSKMVAARLIQSFGASATNSFEFSYSGNRIFISQGGAGIPGNASLNSGAKLNSAIVNAIPYIFPLSGKAAGTNVTHPLFWGSQGYPALWNEAPWKNSLDIYDWKDDFDKVVGNHDLKVGFLFDHEGKNQQAGFQAGDFDESPQFWGPGEGNVLAGCQWGCYGTTGGGSTGNTVADFLLKGTMFGMSEFNGSPTIESRWNDLGAYVGDAWRISPRLTVDYGVRWQMYPAANNATNELANFQPSLFNPTFGNSACNGLLFPPGTNFSAANFVAANCSLSNGAAIGPNSALINGNNHLFSPRLGIAWDPTGTGTWAIRVGAGQFFWRPQLDPFNFHMLTNPPFEHSISGARTLDSAATLIGSSTSLGFPSYGIQTTGLVNNHWQWNLTVEHQLWRNTVLQASYVGSRGIHLFSPHDANAVPPANRYAYMNCANTNPGGATATCQANQRPISAYGNVSMEFVGYAQGSSYNALDIGLQGRFGKRGSMYMVSYTHSKLIDYNQVNGGSTDAMDPYNINLDRGLSGYDVPNRFVANAVYMLPELRRTNAFVRNTLGSWALTTIATFSNGPALTIGTGNVDISGIGATGQERPDRVSGVSCRGSGLQWLNPAAFTYVGHLLGTDGNSARGTCFGPGINNWDIGVHKDFKLTERVGMQFRLDMFNAFNHTQYTNVNTAFTPIIVCYGGPNFPTTTSGSCVNAGTTIPESTAGNAATAATEIVASGLDVNGNAAQTAISSGFGRIQSARPAREIQYTLQITF